MTMEEYLYKEGTGRLTQEDIQNGWHFCADWDCMLIGKNWPEMEACTCFVDE